MYCPFHIHLLNLKFSKSKNYECPDYSGLLGWYCVAGLMSFQTSKGLQFFHLQGPRSPRRRSSLCIFLNFTLTPLSEVQIFSSVDFCQTLSIYVRTEVLGVVTTNDTVFGRVIPLNLEEVYQCFKASGCLYFKSDALMRKQQVLWKCQYTPCDYKV